MLFVTHSFWFWFFVPAIAIVGGVISFYLIKFILKACSIVLEISIDVFACILLGVFMLIGVSCALLEKVFKWLKSKFKK